MRLIDTLTVKLIVLNHCQGIGRRKVWRMIHSDPSLQQLDRYTPNDLIKSFGMSSSQALCFLQDFQSIKPFELCQQFQKERITPIPFHHPHYPQLLKTIYDPPYILYAKGRTELLKDKKTLSVVGTRHPSAESGKIMKNVLDPIIEQGWTIISGMAMGVDGMAHQLSLAGRTIAVLGSGLYHPYPLQHRQLYQRLCDAQLVISEYPPSARPERWRFPERNRIISGMALGTLVIEAKEKSGSLITADQALDQGRDVFAIPGSILRENSGGTNRLIQQGAKLVCDWHDIIDELSWTQDE
ncbi:DNA-binding protein [Sporolactobacillus laevolacticus DSM 442]|uniref:DNA-binding protein n=2 Tax=Sporolactobacillus laevolacticus TaxID=33018 RepID=V6IZY0_9BACL|nr:DNA-binding protein [Sporolactobacillus laevolacticus DSM 442]